MITKKRRIGDNKKELLVGSKYEFWLEQVAFISHIVTKDGIYIDSSKVKVVSKLPTPKTVTKDFSINSPKL